VFKLVSYVWPKQVVFVSRNPTLNQYETKFTFKNPTEKAVMQ